MRVGGKRGSGGAKGAGGAAGASGAKGPQGASKVEGPSFAEKVDKNAGVESASVAATRNVAPSAIISEAIGIARALQQGAISSKAEATGQLVESILNRKLGRKFSKNKKISKAIAETLGEDPHLASVLERIWSHREG
jgi:hypothetical protein